MGWGRIITQLGGFKALRRRGVRKSRKAMGTLSRRGFGLAARRATSHQSRSYKLRVRKTKGKWDGAGRGKKEGDNAIRISSRREYE